MANVTNNLGPRQSYISALPEPKVGAPQGKDVSSEKLITTTSDVSNVVEDVGKKIGKAGRIVGALLTQHSKAAEKVVGTVAMKPAKAAGGAAAVKLQKAVARRKAYEKARNLTNNRGAAAVQRASADAQLAKLRKVTSTGLAAVGHALNVATSVISAKEAYGTSVATSQAGKTTEAVANGATNLALSYTPIAVVTAAESLAFNDPKKKVVTGIYNGTASAVGAAVDLAATGDGKALEALNQRNLKGENGYVMQAAAQAGEYWSQKGIGGGLQEFGASVASLF